MSLGSNGVNRVHSLRKIPKCLRDTNFCTSLARFARVFLRQPNGPKCTQIVRNAPKHEFRVQWGGSRAFVAKHSNGTSWHELSHQFCTFPSSFASQPNSPSCTKIVWNAQKYEFRVQWGGSGVFVAKNSDGTSWHEVFHQFDSFYTKCCYATKLSQMHPNNTKHTKTWV